VAPEYRLPRAGQRDARLALLIGSSRAFWQPFLAWLREDATRVDVPDPIDRYVVEVVTDALAASAVAHAVRFSFEAPPRRVAMQRLADVSGLAALTPAMLCVHPTFGPWIALRAAAVFDVAPPDDEVVAGTTLACHECAARCAPALERALAATAARAGGTAAEVERRGGDPVAPDWQLWLAVRDACPLGREHRYPEAYLRYVYTKDREVLRAAVAAGPEDDRPGTAA
jgi:methylmalonic aciduria homocystinuria type C protein